ncbi:MAG TPA: amino acid ABC transporter ATP-binding protein [Mycobacteriales bacterium]|nr:amino acid ABC transporter ATP-binding protein [Mycobacteriales bacterium]
MTASMLAVRGLVKSYGGTPVLQGIDLDVDAHQVVCLIGPSGSGKSTLLRCIALLEEVDDGAIWLGGRDLSDPQADVKAERRTIGIVFQAFNLFPHMTVLDNITLAPRKVHGTGRRVAEAEARSMLGRFGLADRAGDYPDRLSGGQQQRVAIIRSLATRPRALLLDEVTSALDPELVAEVLDVIKELKASGLTMVIATHEMGFARQAADQVYFLDQGKVIERGPAGQVLGAPREARTQQFLTRLEDAGRL